MQFGPPTIGETVDAIAFNARFRGTLVAYHGDTACIAVLGYAETLQVPRSAVVPVR